MNHNSKDDQPIHDRTQGIANQYRGLSIYHAIDDPQESDAGVDRPRRQGLTWSVLGVGSVQLHDLGDCRDWAYHPSNDHRLIEFGFPP
jgi:hypothetical protein